MIEQPEGARLKLTVRGAVQGVGFRPFVHRLAGELDLRGGVANTAQGVVIEVEGPRDRLAEFARRLESEKPAIAYVQSVESSWLDPLGLTGFEIQASEAAGAKSAIILPDLATCADCLRDIFDPTNRRYRYPFTNCTNCGPRFSIIEALPYDRASTSMRKFQMCAECELEYHDPADRRFHAQPNACPRCGPRLSFWDARGATTAEGDDALQAAIDALRGGNIIALQGVGGFQLLVDAHNDEAIRALRTRKHRGEKPFALLHPSLAAARTDCEIIPAEETLLLSTAAPIVLLRRRALNAIAPSVAPGNPYLGVMLPCTPLHHLLLAELGFPVVATSGNLSDEPICIDPDEARQRLAGIADFFLVHDRPIVRPIDDSVACIMAGRELILRRARGYAPLPIAVREGAPILALGAHLKNTVALAVGGNAFVSQHLGDLATPEAYAAFRAAAGDLPRLYETQPEVIACDFHPEYLSTKFARERSAQPFPVQHHLAHIAACMAENEIDPPVLGVAWDGTGDGGDGTIWGGEFLQIDHAFEVTRAAHLRTFALPGGEAAIREPRRSALGLLHEIFREELWARQDLTADFSATELPPLRTMLERSINSPRTSSAGRLFDAVAALTGLRTHASFEGQAAMELEFALNEEEQKESYSFALREGQPCVIDWEPAIEAIIRDHKSDVSRATMSAKFHNGLANMIVAVAQRMGARRVVLSGGCFQNRRLTKSTITRLRQENLQPYWHQRIPPNDGGIALGQIVVARWASAPS